MEKKNRFFKSKWALFNTVITLILFISLPFIARWNVKLVPVVFFLIIGLNIVTTLTSINFNKKK